MWKTTLTKVNSQYMNPKGGFFNFFEVVLYFITWNVKKEFVLLHNLKHHWQPSTSNKITVLFWRSAFKSVNFGLYSCQAVFSYSIFRYKKKNLRSLINKTIGSQYSLWCVPPGISIPLLWTLIKCLNSVGCFFFHLFFIFCFFWL